jgi:hypothetical protein
MIKLLRNSNNQIVCSIEGKPVCLAFLKWTYGISVIRWAKASDEVRGITSPQKKYRRKKSASRAV